MGEPYADADSVIDSIEFNPRTGRFEIHFGGTWYAGHTPTWAVRVLLDHMPTCESRAPARQALTILIALEADIDAKRWSGGPPPNVPAEMRQMLAARRRVPQEPS